MTKGKEVVKDGKHMSLREQENVINELQKMNFDLRLKIVFYEQRLSALAPGQIDEALRRNIQYQVSHETDKVELRRYRKLVEEHEREKERGEGERDALEDKDPSDRLREELEAEQAAKEDLLQDKDNLEYELRQVQSALDEAADEIARLKDAAVASTATAENEQELVDLREQIEQLHQENNEIRDSRSRQAFEAEEVEHQLEEKEREVDALLREMDAKDAEHASAVRKHEEVRQLDDDEAARQDEGAKDTIDGLMRELREKHDAVQSGGEDTRALRADLDQLADQLDSLSTSHATQSTLVIHLTRRAETAERRLAATQSQLVLVERALDEARTKVSTAENNWEGRFKELQRKLLVAEEKLRRERQGARARLAELDETIRSLKGQVSDAERRDGQLGGLLERNVAIDDVD
ncbi:hypothetical protein RQP46_008144 [Phenoliferia psychrophenolica]